MISVGPKQPKGNWRRRPGIGDSAGLDARSQQLIYPKICCRFIWSFLSDIEPPLPYVSRAISIDKYIHSMCYFKVAEQSPSRHRSSGDSLDVFSSVVAVLVFPETSIGLLDRDDSSGDVGDPFLIHIVAHSGQAREDCCYCIDIVDSPSRTPHPIFSWFEQVLNTFLQHFRVIDTCVSHPLKQVSDDVGAGRIKYLCTFIDLSHPKDEGQKFILAVIFIFVKGWEPSIRILIAL